MNTATILALGVVGLLALSASSSKKRPPPASSKLSREQCIDKWSNHLAQKIDSEKDPARLRTMADVLGSVGMAPNAQACLRERAADLEQGGSARSCHALVYAALVKDFSGMTDPNLARAIASQAGAAGQPELEACFNAIADTL